MEVLVQNSTILFPELQKPHEIPLTIFDIYASNIHMAVVYAFTPPTLPNSQIIEGLSKTLAHFPTLTAQLSLHQKCLLVGSRGGGALVVEATVSSNLSGYMPLVPSPDFSKLHPSAEEPTHILQVQLNRFLCGGLVIAVTCHHRVSDGQSMSNFFIAWGKAARGLPIDPPPTYNLSWLKPRTPPKCQFQHWNLEFMHSNATSSPSDIDPDMVTNILLHYSLDFIATKLKPKLQDNYTTFEALAAHLWRKITIARGLDKDTVTTLRVSVNGRPRLKPPVAPEFFGNLVLNAHANLEVKSLLQGGLEDAAKSLRDAIRMIDEHYFQSVIDFGEMHKNEDIMPCYDTSGTFFSPVLEVDSWLRFRFEQVDFGGGGKLCGFMPSWVPVEGVMVFLPSLVEVGGVDAFVALLKEDAEKLKLISHSL